MTKKNIIPKEMQAVEVTKDHKLALTRRAVPAAKAGEILIRVHAAGINRPDILQRKGLYPPPPGITDIPGLEVAGEIAALGKGVKGFKVGDKICALLAGGGYAEYCVAPALQCLPVPKGMEMIKAAAVPEAFFTVWTNLFDRGNLKKDESILIHGGASGIGTTAIQIAKSFGAAVFVTAGNHDKIAACKKLGAKAAIHYKQQDFVTEVMKETENEGVDVIIDMIGGDYIPRNIKILKTGGRHVSIAMQHGRKAEIDIFEIMSKRLVMTGSTLRSRSIADKGAIAKALKKSVWPLLGRKKISPVIDKVFKLAEAQTAHDYLEAGNHFGKVVLKVV
jgi:NADPH2:quinone reductase